MTMILKILAAIFTGIGGHYLNRRWDKAVLFLCLFVLYWATVYGLFVFFLWNNLPSSSGMMQDFGSTRQLVSKIASIGVFAIWLVSLIVTILDCKNNIEPNITKWTKSGIAGAIITSILSFILLAFAVIAVFSLSRDQLDYAGTTSYETKSSSFYSSSFYEYLYFGGSPSNSRLLPAPPAGGGTLKGQILYQNKPAVGVSLGVVLNSKYRAKDIVTDSDGIFTVHLPLGSWTINSVQTERWENQPQEGSYTMYYGGEEKFSGDNYSRYAYFERKGYPVNVTTNPDTIHLIATINKDIQLIWPDPDVEKIVATIDDTISWEEYPGAHRYYVEIKKMRREGTTTYLEEVTSRSMVNETSIPLSSLKYTRTKGEEKTEYSAEIYAFSEGGTLIAEFSDTFKGGTFLLSGGNILIADELDDLFGLSSIEDSEEFEKKVAAISLNIRRATAVKVLIDDKMLPEAESLLNLIDSEYSKGSKEVLSGYILALQDECNKSEEMFNRALYINPNVCIPDKYKENCER
jgi:hypothetical protein